MSLSQVIPQLRNATDEDLEKIHALDLEAFQATNTADSIETIAERLHNFAAGFLVAEIDRQIIGFASSEIRMVDGERTLRITALAVTEAFQGKRVGSQILDVLIELAKSSECRRITLSTSRADKFYRERGFVETGTALYCGTTLKDMELRL